MTEAKPFPAKAKSLVEFTSQQSTALSLVDDISVVGGHLTHQSGTNDIEVMFQYQGYWFAVHAQQRGTKSVLEIHGIIGHLPFSYHSTFSRRNVWTVVKEAGKRVNGRVQVDDKQRILLIDTVIAEGTLTPRLVVLESTKVMLKLKPYLELIYQLQPPRWIDPRDED